MRVALLILPAALSAGAAAAEPPVCTDRPAKANAVCTVPAGRLQIETSVAGWSLARGGGNRTDLLTLGATYAKLGLSDGSDLQFGFTPFARLRTGGGSGRGRSARSGFGDVVVRYKRRLTSEGAPVRLAAIPFVKVPTAGTGLGNGKAEGGLAVPISFALGGRASATLGPELDLLADADGSGRHLALVNLINLSMPFGARLTAAGELWTNLNFEPSGTARQASLDAALAYAVSPRLQLDAGANFGLTRATSDLEFYAGISIRF